MQPHASYAARAACALVSAFGQNAGLCSLCLLPVTRNPHPATGATHPVTFHPHCRRPRTQHVTSRHPDIVGSGPSPITPCPDISGSWRYRLRFNSDGWWSPSHYHLSGGTGRCHFLCRCRSCHRRRLGRAAHQCKWGQRQQINAFSHISSFP
jgi:hypothetical protein